MLQVASHDDNAALALKLIQARQSLRSVYAELPDEDWSCERFPYLTIVNPPLWEWAHVAWFQEYWCHRFDFLKHTPVAPSRMAQADAWVDSRTVEHPARWRPGHPARRAVEQFLDDTLSETLKRLSVCPPEALYPFRLALYHETMHVEALLMTLRTLGRSLPAGWATSARPAPPPDARPPAAGDALQERGVDECRVAIGSPADSLHFVFDNERNSHYRSMPAFRIDTWPVSQAAFREFVGQEYGADRIWTAAGLAWRSTRPGRQRFWLESLEEVTTEPIEGVSVHEADAFCRWAGRRLPTEFEWETAAARQLLRGTGQVWEWTASPFLPYEGFSADPYQEYSQPWFGDHVVLKGGSWATHPDLKRPAFRNFYLPGRSDVFAGFRTCAV